MTRLLLLLACAVVAALLWPRRRIVTEPDEPLRADPYLCGLAG